MVVFLILSCVTVVAIGYWYWCSQTKQPNSPPGPWPSLPLFGHLIHLGLEPYKKAIDWKPVYGPILGVKFGRHRSIIISNSQISREAYTHQAFAARPPLGSLATQSEEGVAFTSGSTWVEQRGFTHRRLKQWRSMLGGAGEGAIVSQARELVQQLGGTGTGTPVNPEPQIYIAFCNTLWTILLGTPFSQADPALAQFTELIVDTFGASSPAHPDHDGNNDWSTWFSMLSGWMCDTWPTGLTRPLDNRLGNVFKRAGDMLQPYIDQHWATHVAGEPRDWVDAYIDKILAAKDPCSSFHGNQGHRNLVATLLELFIAAVEATGATFSWICLLLAAYPQVQERLAAEIQTVLGGSGASARAPCTSDRKRMPYTEAVIHEVMRFRTLMPLSIFRSTTEDVVNFHGYDIQKGTMVYMNLYEAHNNLEVWGDPENFRPERWLIATADVRRPEGFMPFSAGKRVCLGQQLALDQLFLFTGCLCQSYTLGLAKSDKGLEARLEPSLRSSLRVPKPYKLLFTMRK